MCGIGATRVVLHIRSGSVGGGSAESCGNASVLNVVEILPCAERAPLHMGAHPLKTDVPGKPRNRAENPESVRGDAPLRCATPPHGPRRIRLAREGARQEPGPSKPRGRSSPPTTLIPASAPPFPARKAQCTYRCMVFPDTPKKGQPIKLMPSQCTCRCVVLPDTLVWLLQGFVQRLNAPAGAWCSLTRRANARQENSSPWSQCTCRCVVLPDYGTRAIIWVEYDVSMHLQVRGAP